MPEITVLNGTLPYGLQLESKDCSDAATAVGCSTWDLRTEYLEVKHKNQTVTAVLSWCTDCRGTLRPMPRLSDENDKSEILFDPPRGWPYIGDGIPWTKMTTLYRKEVTAFENSADSGLSSSCQIACRDVGSADLFREFGSGTAGCLCSGRYIPPSLDNNALKVVPSNLEYNKMAAFYDENSALIYALLGIALVFGGYAIGYVFGTRKSKQAVE